MGREWAALSWTYVGMSLGAFAVSQLHNPRLWIGLPGWTALWFAGSLLYWLGKRSKP